MVYKYTIYIGILQILKDIKYFIEKELLIPINKVSFSKSVIIREI